MLCDRKLPGRRGECRNPMQESIDSLGRVSWTCLRCEQVAKGFCWECGEKKEGKRIYCEPCGKKKQKEAIRRFMKTDEHKRRSALYHKRKSKDPEFKKKKSAQRKAWLERNPQKKEQYKMALIYRELACKKT